MKKALLIVAFAMSSLYALADGKIKVYFNHPVDTAVAQNVDAIYLNNCVADTVIAYINRAKYSLDIAMYNYVQGSFSNIANAVNAAYSRGVKVRWIYDGSSSNTGVDLLNSGIYSIASPTTSAYGIMHNKFMVIDAYSDDTSDAIVWTGSTNWTSEQLATDYNNIIIFQDSALAHVYTQEFNMMWGSTTTTPDSALSKFGPHKTDLGRHSFTIDGQHVELYFSPSDHTNNHIESTILSANTDLYFGMYTFTYIDDAKLIAQQYRAGVYVAGINDEFSDGYDTYDTLSAALGSKFISYHGTGIYHNKFLIVDRSAPCSDPVVLTGSHNWSASANTKNDENAVIVHDKDVADQYYQSFYANFILFGGSLAQVSGCTTNVNTITNAVSDITVFPNPSTGDVQVSYELSETGNVVIDVYNEMGRLTIHVISEKEQAGYHNHLFRVSQKGVYFLKMFINNSVYSKVLTIQ